MSSFDITLLISILVLASYAVSGIINYRRDNTYDGYFLSDRKLGGAEVRNTFAGAAISVSTVLVFFLTLSVRFGWQVVISPVTLALGVLVFAHVIYPRLMAYPGLQDKLKGNAHPPVDSIGDLTQFLYGSASIGRMVTIVAAIGSFAVLIAELMVGVTLYKEYFLKPEYIVFIVAATLFIYAGFGGLKSIVHTDKWQVRVIVLSVATIVVSLIVSRLSQQGTAAFDDISLVPQAVMTGALVLNILIVNLCFLPSSMRVWQVVAASSQSTGFKRALWFSTALIAFVSLMAVLMSLLVAEANDGKTTLEDIFSFFANSDSSWLSMVLYPIFVVALLSSLVSTADSAILPLVQAFSRRNETSWNQNVIILRLLGLLAITICGYFVVAYVFDLSLVAWILTVFSITTCIAPTVVFPLFQGPRVYPSWAKGTIIAGAIIGSIVALIWSIYFKTDLSMQPFNCLLGTGISALSCWIASRGAAPMDVPTPPKAPLTA